MKLLEVTEAVSVSLTGIIHIKTFFSQDQISVLEQLMDKADDEQKKVLDQMLREYGSNKYSPAV